jgi:hypothetical protein
MANRLFVGNRAIYASPPYAHWVDHYANRYTAYSLGFVEKKWMPADGYYKIDVYLYYAFTFLLPILVGWRKSQKAG